MMTWWLDTSSSRCVCVLHAHGARDWPTTPSWDGEYFALFVATDRDLDIGSMPERALEQGLAAVAAWGVRCQDVETAFDEAIVGDGSKVETIENVILTTSHAEESLQDALEFFLGAFFPATSYKEGCRAWVIFAIGSVAHDVEKLLLERGAERST
jgi:hypothetical protein